MDAEKQSHLKFGFLNMKFFLLAFITAVVCFAAAVHAEKRKIQMYYCEYCGAARSSVATLTASLCSMHPNGSGKGRHKLYEGSEKEKYACKHCGAEFSTISVLSARACPRHPDGANKGRHSPAR